MTNAAHRALLRIRIRFALWRSEPDLTVRTGPADQRHIFVILAADYGNLGDLAITRAQLTFLRREFPDSVIAEVPISRTFGAVKQLKQTIRHCDVITLVGGGNTGDAYDDIQYLRELVISAFPKNQIISFPQTIDFSDSTYGRWASRRAQRVYRSHPDLILAARDSTSFERAQAMFADSHVVLAPDVVLSLDAQSGADRHGVTLALRADLERGLSDSAHELIVEAVREFGEVHQMDTHLGDVRLSREEADAELDSYWRHLSRSQLVVTDRLHGMIFAVITGTPCLAFDNETHKVANFYRDWLQDVPGVLLLNSPDEVKTSIGDVVGTSPGKAWPTIRKAFEDELRQALTDVRRGG